jgi:hypothetical protein
MEATVSFGQAAFEQPDVVLAKAGIAGILSLKLIVEFLRSIIPESVPRNTTLTVSPS